jgi:SPP1 family holin
MVNKTKAPDAATITRTILVAIAMLNQILTLMGKVPLDLDETTLYPIVSGIFTVVATVWAWWKNNSFTKEAIRAQEFLEELKK